MKRINILLVVLIILCLGGFYGYRVMDSMKTDTVAPEIQMEEKTPRISVKDPEKILLRGVTATDDQDGDVTDSLVVENVTLLDKTGRLMVSYAAFDKAGNVTKAQREAMYKDYESPKFTMEEPLLFRSGTSFDILSVVGAEDVIEGDIQHRVRATALEEGSIAELGLHKVGFRVTNSLGDSVSQIFYVEVYDPSVYQATLTLNKYLVYLPVGASFNPTQYLKEFTLGMQSDFLNGTLPEGYSLETEGRVYTSEPGTYSVGIRVTYTEKSQYAQQEDRKYTGYTRMTVVVEG